jgi:hypothetical protein
MLCGDTTFRGKRGLLRFARNDEWGAFPLQQTVIASEAKQSMVSPLNQRMDSFLMSGTSLC